MIKSAFPALWRFFPFAAALVLCLVCCGSQAETPSSPPFEDGEFTEEVFTDAPDLVMLTESSFDAADIPQSYLNKAEHQGRVEKIFYYTSAVSVSTIDDAFGGSSGGAAATVSETSAEGKTVKSVMVYFPAGYDDSDELYNVLYSILLLYRFPDIPPQKAGCLYASASRPFGGKFFGGLVYHPGCPTRLTSSCTAFSTGFLRDSPRFTLLTEYRRSPAEATL